MGISLLWSSRAATLMPPAPCRSDNERNLVRGGGLLWGAGRADTVSAEVESSQFSTGMEEMLGPQEIGAKT